MSGLKFLLLLKLLDDFASQDAINGLLNARQERIHSTGSKGHLTANGVSKQRFIPALEDQAARRIEHVAACRLRLGQAIRPVRGGAEIDKIGKHLEEPDHCWQAIHQICSAEIHTGIDAQTYGNAHAVRAP